MDLSRLTLWPGVIVCAGWLAEASAGITTSFDYDECSFSMGGPYPCRATYHSISGSDTLLLRLAELRAFDGDRKVMIIDEVRYWYQQNAPPRETHWTIERDLYGKFLTESTDFGTGVTYKTIYEYATSPGQSVFPDLPISSVTTLAGSGETVATAVVIKPKRAWPWQKSEEHLRLKVTLFQDGRPAVEGIEHRDPNTGLVTSVESADDGYRASNVLPWWPSRSFGWSTARR